MLESQSAPLNEIDLWVKLNKQNKSVLVDLIIRTARPQCLLKM